MLGAIISNSRQCPVLFCDLFLLCKVFLISHKLKVHVLQWNQSTAVFMSKIVDTRKRPLKWNPLTMGTKMSLVNSIKQIWNISWKLFWGVVPEIELITYQAGTMLLNYISNPKTSKTEFILPYYQQNDFIIIIVF